MKKIVFITGATSGFGEACAYTFAANNYHLILNGRRLERLQTLQQNLKEKFDADSHLLPFDVQKQNGKALMY